MPTKNPRINITFEEPVALFLTSLASYEHKSLAGLAKELILEALERREDIALSEIAHLRDKKNAQRVKHADAWK